MNKKNFRVIIILAWSLQISRKGRKL